MEQMASSQETAWYAICLSLYENRDDVENCRMAVEYFQNRSPDSVSYSAAEKTLDGAGISFLNLLDGAGLRAVASAESWYAYNEIKNKARADAHASGTARRLESTKNTIEAICSHCRRRAPPTYSGASKSLSRFLKTHGHEMGLGPVIYGLQQWVGAHIGKDVCFDYSIPGEIFSERKTSFTENFCLVLCHFGSLVAISDTDFNECSFVWRYHSHFSDKYSIRVARKISRMGILAVHHPGVLIESSARRENIRGQNDSLYHYTLNTLMCPIL